MKIGLLVHSQTGNTLSVAEKLLGKLQADGHSASIERIIPDDERQMDAKRVKLLTIPDTGVFDSLIFCAPVHGFSVSSSFKAFISQAGSLKGKKVCCCVTHAFPFAWMGGNQSISQMKKLCEEKGAVVAETGIINWMGGSRDKKITDMVEKFSKALG